MKEKYRIIPSRVSLLRHNVNECLTKKMRQAGWKGIAPSHGGIIYSLLHYDVLTMKEIANKVKRDPSTVTTLVSKLEKMGYVEYMQNPEDRRSKQVRLTAKGKELHSDFCRISEEFTDVLLDGVTDEQAEDFLATLEKMNKNINSGLQK